MDHSRRRQKLHAPSERTLKELESTDLGGGITLRRVEPIGGSHKHLHHPFFIVSLVWPGEPPVPDSTLTTPIAQRQPTPVPRDLGGCVEARIFPPRPKDGPGGVGFLVTDCPGEAGTTGHYDTYEEALEAVVRSIRTWDASRRLIGGGKSLP